MYYYHRHGAVSSIFRTMIIIFSILVNIKKGNSIKKGQLPVMGWSGYNAFMQNSGHCDVAGASGYNETTFLETADILIKTGLAKLGYVYINADDCWIAQNRTKDGKLAADPSRFPHGMKYLADALHGKKHMKRPHIRTLPAGLPAAGRRCRGSPRRRAR